jgi:hypothetical protein
VQAPRIILYHKQSASARTRFLRLAHGGVCGPEALPTLSSLLEEGDIGTLVSHPAPVLAGAERALGLGPGALEAEPSFRGRVETPDGPIAVFLARFTTLDPPFELAVQTGGAFIDLTQARGMSPAELGLLRRAYEVILG